MLLLPKESLALFLKITNNKDQLGIYRLFFIENKAISLEIRLLAAVYPSPHIHLTDTIERGANSVGMSIPPPAIIESRDREPSSRLQPYKAFFLMGGIKMLGANFKGYYRKLIVLDQAQSIDIVSILIYFLFFSISSIKKGKKRITESTKCERL